MRKTFRIGSLIVATLLAACGGGGGGTTGGSTGGNGGGFTYTGTCPDGSTQTSTVSKADAVAQCAIPGNLASSAPTPTYAAGSDNLHAFQVLNQARIGGGFGALAQSASLDTAASSHAQYLFANAYANGAWNDSALNVVDTATGWLRAHVEVAGKTGFTGILPVDRAKAAGYQADWIGEVVSPVYTATITQGGFPGCVENLLATVFHRNGMLDPSYRDVGISIAYSADGAGYVCVIDPARTTSVGIPPSGWVAVYPAPNQTAVLTSITFGEAPDPVPTAPVKGNPISLQIEASKVLTVTSFTVVDSLGTTVPAKLLMKADFPDYLGQNVAYLVPTQALAKNTTYTVHFSGAATVPGATPTTISRDWSFKTGSF